MSNCCEQFLACLQPLTLSSFFSIPMTRGNDFYLENNASFLT